MLGGNGVILAVELNDIVVLSHETQATFWLARIVTFGVLPFRLNLSSA